MRLEDMRYFVEIVNAKSINQASKTLFVAQPALSRMITSLETDLGFPLLERSKHGIQPTKHGMEVYNDFNKILQLYDESRLRWQNLAYDSIDSFLPVNIMALPMLCNTIMNEIFLEIARQYPKIQLKLYEYQLGNILEKSISKSSSIGFSHYNEQTKNEVYQFAKDNKMQIIPLFDDEYIFFVSSQSSLIGKSLTIESLKDCTIASYSNTETETDPKFIAAGLTGFTDKFKNTIYLSNRHSINDLIISNKAIGLSADIITRSESYRKNGSIQPLKIDDCHIPMTYFLIFSAEPSIEESIVVDTIKKHYLDLARSSK